MLRTNLERLSEGTVQADERDDDMYILEVLGLKMARGAIDKQDCLSL